MNTVSVSCLTCGRDLSDGARGLGMMLVLAMTSMIWLAIGIGIGFYLCKAFA